MRLNSSLARRTRHHRVLPDARGVRGCADRTGPGGRARRAGWFRRSGGEAFARGREYSSTQNLQAKNGPPGPGGAPNGPQAGPDIPMFPPGSPFEQFFKDFLNRGRPGQRGEGPPRPQRKAQSLGSGFIIDGSGLVVTNNHVIDGADEVSVILQDNTTLKAEVVGRDETGDIALLKVSSDKPLPVVEFGDSNVSRVGDWVLAIGNPFGLGGTVTAGIVSARSRDIRQGAVRRLHSDRCRDQQG